MKRFLQPVLVLNTALLLATLVRAQPVSGDLVISDSLIPSRGLLLYRTGTGALNTYYSGFAGLFPNAITMAPDNSAVFVPFVEGVQYTSGMLAAVTPAGGISTLALMGSSSRFSNGQAMDGDGAFINAGQTGALLRLDPSTFTLATLASVSGSLNDVTLDRDRGTYVAIIYPYTLPYNGSLIEYDPATAAVTTLLAGSALISYPSGVVQDPTTGDFLISRFLAPGLVRIDAVTKAVSTVWNQKNANALSITPRNTFLCATETTIQEIDGGGAVLQTYSLSASLRITGVGEYGSRRVTTSGTPTPGNTLLIAVHSGKTSDSGKSYYLGMSFSTRPAVGIFPNGEVLNLATDDLFFTTTSNSLPHIFINFQGVLDSTGSAQAAVIIPALLPSGLNIPLHVGGVVADPAAPGRVSTVLTSTTFTLR